MIDLLKKWLNGRARARDERKLEAEARADDFLAEALEGYRSKPEADHAANIAKLKQQLRQKSKRRGAAVVWWRVAAAATLVGVVATWLIVSQDLNPVGIAASETAPEKAMESREAEEVAPLAPATSVEDPTLELEAPEAGLAVVEEQRASANAPQAGLTRESKIVNEDEAPAADYDPGNIEVGVFEVPELVEEAMVMDARIDSGQMEDPAENPALANNLAYSTVDSNTLAEQEADEVATTINSAAVQTEKELQVAPPIEPFADVRKAKAKKRKEMAAENGPITQGRAKKERRFLTLRGTVIELETEEGLIGANVQIKGSKEGTVTDFDGAFELRSDQALPWVLELSYTGFSTKEVVVESVADVLVARMEDGGALLDEVVVTGYAQNKKLVEIDPRPKGGWKKFERYIQKNLQYPETAKSEGLEGTVKVDFFINEKGEAEQFIILESLCAPCDLEAVRLLKEGPKWRGKNKRTTVLVKFK